MKTVQFQDDQGGELTLQEDAGCLFATNVSAETLANLRTFEARADDILIVSYPKSGTHWLTAIVSMLVQRLDKLATINMVHTEYTPTRDIDATPGQRVLCTHMPFGRLPADFLHKKSKILLCLRNPRDVAVSYFKFCSNMKPIDYRGSFSGFFSLFLNGSLPYNSWFSHTAAWLDAARSGKHNIHIIYYEDLKQNFFQSVSSLSRFLQVDMTPEVFKRVQRETTFENMKVIFSDYLQELSKDGNSVIYRKGKVGDWRNYFTRDHLILLDKEMKAWDLKGNKHFWFTEDEPLVDTMEASLIIKTQN